MNKFELIRFVLKADKERLAQGRFDCINGNFYMKNAKEFMDFYKIRYDDKYM